VGLALGGSSPSARIYSVVFNLTAVIGGDRRSFPFARHRFGRAQSSLLPPSSARARSLRPGAVVAGAAEVCSARSLRPAVMLMVVTAGAPRHRFGPTYSSRIATDFCLATDTSYLVHGRHCTPSFSQASVNSRRMSSERFENW
jgi:hypothetical protein